jgi:mono/diheme cytochrome c family protein
VRVLAAIAGLVLLAAAPAHARDYDLAALESAKPELTDEGLEAGEALYSRWCAACHGDTGAGDGPAAAGLWPRPRDFSYGLFKFRSTATGELPTDADIFRSIARGVPATSMPAWGEGRRPLSDAEIWQLVQAVKALVPFIDWSSADFDPYRDDAKVALGTPPAVTAELIELGRTIYSDEQKGGCVRCHGALGRGDGKGPDARLEDDWSDPILPTDLTSPRRYRNGTSLLEIARTFSTGLNGTPMPSYVASMTDEERWAVAAFTRSLLEPDQQGNVLLVASPSAGEPPVDPQDPFWADMPTIEIPVTGQALVAPRHENHAIDRAQLQAATGGGRFAVRITWNDRTESRTEREAKPPDGSTPWLAARALWRGTGKGSDGLTVQIPRREPDHPVKPHFYRGGPGGGVVLWGWDGATDASTELDSAGWAALPRAQAGEGQELSSASHFDRGRWSVVISRPLETADPTADLQLRPGMLVPVALQLWDGGLGETITACGITSWYYVQLPAPVPASGYAAGAAAALGGLLLCWLAVGQARREQEGRS